MIENKNIFDSIKEMIEFKPQNFIDKGIFITSEPSISKYWIELSALSEIIIKEKLQEKFFDDIEEIINQVIKDIYGYENNQVMILNFCNDESSLSDKDFHVLYDFKYNNEAFEANIIGDEITLPQKRNMDIILLTAIDSNVTSIKKVMDKLRTEMESRVVAIVTVISIVNLHEYLSDIEDTPWIYSFFKVKEGKLIKNLPWFKHKHFKTI